MRFGCRHEASAKMHWTLSADAGAAVGYTQRRGAAGTHWLPLAAQRRPPSGSSRSSPSLSVFWARRGFTTHVYICVYTRVWSCTHSHGSSRAPVVKSLQAHLLQSRVSSWLGPSPSLPVESWPANLYYNKINNNLFMAHLGATGQSVNKSW